MNDEYSPEPKAHAPYARGLSETMSASIFWSSDKPMREPITYEPIPSQIRYQCGQCKVWMNHDFEIEPEAYCMNHHLNVKSESARIVWSGQKP